MKKSFFIIALSLGMVACSSDTTTETTEGETTETGSGSGDDKLKEMDRLSTERDALYDKHIESLENGNMTEANAFKAQMDSVDAIYQEVLRK